MTRQRIPVADIPPTLTPAGPGRLVLLRYSGSRAYDTIPALVIRAFPGCAPGQPVPTHSYVNVVPFGDGPNNAPVIGAGEPLFSLYLFDPLNGAIPDVGTQAQPGSAFDGRAVWCEWMPYQKQKHDARDNTPGPTA